MKTLRWAQVILAVSLLLVFAPAIMESFRHHNETQLAIYEATQLLSEDALKSRLQQVENELHALPADDPAQYYRTLVFARQTEGMLEKYRRENNANQLPNSLPSMMVGGYLFQVRDLQQKYLSKFGPEAMDRARPESINQQIGLIDPQGIPSRTSELMAQGYISSVVIAMLFFWVTLQLRNMLVIVELHKIVLASLVWPIAIWKYPVDVSPLEQIRKFKRMVSYAFSILLSFGTASFAKAGTGEKDTESWGSPTYSYAIGVDSRKIVGNGSVVHDGPVAWGDIAVSFKNGVTIDMWGSRRTSGSGSSDEVDLTVSKAWQLDDGYAVDGAIAYWGIAPVRSLAGGDIISPSVKLRKSLSKDVTIFVKAASQLLTSDIKRNGNNIQAGTSVSSSFGRATASLAASLVRFNGPFGKPSGTDTRIDASVSMPIAPKATLSATLKSFIPWAHGQPPASQVGLALSFGF